MNILEIATVITGSAPYILLSVGIAKGKIKQSVATWMLWLVLDSIVLRGIIAQHGNYILFLVFTAGTLMVTMFLLFAKQFAWGKFESFVAVLVVLCVIIFLTSGPYVATIATTAALNIAGIPQFIVTLREPKSASPGAYSLFATASLLSVIGAEAWTVQDRLPQMSSFIFCTLIVFLSLRKK